MQQRLAATVISSFRESLEKPADAPIFFLQTSHYSPLHFDFPALILTLPFFNFNFMSAEPRPDGFSVE